MSFPICMNCDHGIVTQRKVANGEQEPKKIIWCSFMRVEVPDDLSFCSKQASPNQRIHFYDTQPEPTLLNSQRGMKKAVADVLLIMLKARLRP